MLLEDEVVEDLLGRSPSGSYPRIPVPTELRGMITDWRPILGEAEPLMALLQLNLFSIRRDEDYSFRQNCANVPLYHERVFGAFGMPPQVGWNQGINSAMLLELYRRLVDRYFATTDYHPKKGKARVIKSHAIPDTIVHKAKEVMLSPEEYGDWKYLISGRSASRPKWTRQARQEREDFIEDQEPAVEPPEATRDIQSYLNGLDQQTFGHGGHGILRGEQIDKAIEVARRLDEEQRRDQELRKLYWIRKHPQPLYMPCDRFPRLKADRHNQAMNLPSSILRSMYHERDRELDLSKAHLGSYVPVAKREGLEVPTLERYLEANLNDDTDLLAGGDLWRDLAMSVDTDVVNGSEALRDAVKRAYSAVYGSGKQNLLYRVYEKYGKLTGHYPDEGLEPLRPLLHHPLMEELLSTRDKLEAIITDRGGLEDANGRFIPLDAWDEVKDEENRWRGVMAYVNASYEQEVMAPIFREARKEMESDSYTRFKVWLYQADGVTVRIDRRVTNRPKVVARLRKAVKERADELNVPTELEVDWPE
ncbi:hypothetical protein GGQ10_002107 [Salinibacter ruber]|uniref:hypothetical protein n=1 Tax=Salinibacter ruber TaxID=146919 RepID=UPI002167568F|nr:hypothetical protein [Salinibacter ruber]MCS4087281.1 hypothetical protein [Salinibacter ruber]